jgi:hypothetical protein
MMMSLVEVVVVLLLSRHAWHCQLPHLIKMSERNQRDCTTNAQAPTNTPATNAMPPAITLKYKMGVITVAWNKLNTFQTRIGCNNNRPNSRVTGRMEYHTKLDRMNHIV